MMGGASEAGAKERQVARGIAYVVPMAVGSVVPFVTLPILTRVLTPEDYGAWALAVAYAVFAVGLSGLGLSIGLERNFFACATDRERATLLYSVLAFAAASAAAAGGATWLLREPIMRGVFGSPGWDLLLLIAFLSQMATSLKGLFLTFFRNMGDAKAYAWFNVDETLLAAALSVLFVAGFGWGVTGLGLAYLLAAAGVLGAVVVRMARRFAPAFSAPALADALRIGAPLTPRVFIGVVSNNFDKYLIGLLATMGGVGVFSVGQRVAYAAFSYMTAIENVFVPEVYRRLFDQDARTRASVGLYLTPFAYISAGAALGVALLAPEIVRLVAADAFQGATPIVSVLAVSYGLLFFGKVPQLIVARKTHVTSMLAMLTLGLNVAANLLLVPRWGAAGAAWGALGSGMLAGAVAFVVRQRITPIAWEARPIATTFGILLAAPVLLASLEAARASYAVGLIARLALLGLFLTVGVRIGVVSRDNALLLRGLMLGRLRQA
jgi:O-antigen/teichoic acid export membrane protein